MPLQQPLQIIQELQGARGESAPVQEQCSTEVSGTVLPPHSTPVISPYRGAGGLCWELWVWWKRKLWGGCSNLHWDSFQPHRSLESRKSLKYFKLGIRVIASFPFFILSLLLCRRSRLINLCVCMWKKERDKGRCMCACTYGVWNVCMGKGLKSLSKED